jgi:hypothetical protein
MVHISHRSLIVIGPTTIHSGLPGPAGPATLRQGTENTVRGYCKLAPDLRSDKRGAWEASVSRMEEFPTSVRRLNAMVSRSSWKGYLKLSLVSVPVKAFSAVSPQEGEIHFHQLHESCHSRIKYTKTCPKHGAVPADEIVSGYEYSKDQYVVIDPAELDQLKGESDKSVNVESIVPAGSIDSLYLTERSSYLVPDGRIGQKPYALIEKCLSDQGAIAIARLTLNGKDEVAMIRSLETGFSS